MANQPWYHGNITRSKAENLLSKAAKDGSFLLRDSESIQGAYALCVLYQNCVYTYRILPNEEKKLSVQASVGVPIRFFSVIGDLVEEYHKENLGLVTHLQFAVQNEGEIEDGSEPMRMPPQLPPRNFSGGSSVNDAKDYHSDSPKGSELALASISETYMQRLQHVDTSTIHEDHLKSIQDYFCNSVSLDAEQVQNGNPTLPYLKKLTHGICKNLNSEISRTLPTLEAFQRVLDQQLSPVAGRLKSQVSADPNLSVTFRLEQLTKLLYSIEEKVKNVVFDSVGYDGGHRNSLIPPVTFEVKSDILSIPTKSYLKVDVEGGKVYIKKSKDGSDDKYFVHNKILQLVKSQKVHNKLVIVAETEKEKTQRKEYVFEDSKKREGFCQLLQQMKTKHSDKPEPDMLTIFIGTWNMGNANPPHNITSWFQSKGQGKTRDDTADHIPHDIYVIGTQEDPQGDREWTEVVKSTLRDITNISFKQVAVHTLWSIRIMVLAKPEHENRISHIFSNSVKTGIANALGNKGAVGVSFMFNGTSFGFVNSHLTSGSEKKLRRNQNYTSILRFLNLGDKKLNPFDITHRFTHLFWLGDLNYRVELPSTEAENIVAKIKNQQYQELLSRDQLNMERSEEKVFLHYEEEEITFPPTYRFERDTREKYAYTKAKATGMKYNLPSWCDRVLRKSYPLVHVVCQSYGCTTDIMTSDHSPVFATFEVGVTSQFVSKNDPNSVSQGGIQFMNCVATLKTKSKTRFFIEYHSSCLESCVKSSEGENQEDIDGSIKVRFGAQVELTPIISDPEYLLDQHILIIVKSTDCEESYGEGCVALREAECSNADFSITLTHHGEKTGMLSGAIQLRTSGGKQTEKLYDFIQVEKDDSGGSQKGNKSAYPLPTDISNPSYMSYKAANQSDKGWTSSVHARPSPPGHIGKDLTPGNLSPKKAGQDPVVCCPSGNASEDGMPTEMFDNPLYGSMTKQKGSSRTKEQDSYRKDLLGLPEAAFAFPKLANSEADRMPPVPTPRNRSFTCSETKPKVPAAKKPVVPSRSEAGSMPIARPPLPAKNRPGDPQTVIKPRDYRESSELPSKARDYRDSSELPNKARVPARPSQALPKDAHHEGGGKMGRSVK
ncbi:phosphatidylinositol 3,4,5-trisphosphate 5-phosphatase 1 [Anguilla rostrata]|uniref:phosphatidylinositol 3,4,5-trisphosphate 5-phosphatase 1 n=1 Tax=Anguilla rostrata TaxID=7938 RepID=UPI0030D261BC